jgi:hypothetical protein
MTPLAYDIESAAQAANVTPRTIRSWIGNGWLAAKKQSRDKNGEPTGKYVITHAALVECLENNLPAA